MKRDRDGKGANKFFSSLEERLRSLGEVEVPEALETKLLSAIPTKRAEVAESYTVRWIPSVFDLSLTATAAVLFLVLMLMINHGLPIPSQSLSAGLSETSSYFVTTDQNHIIAAGVVPYNLEWSVPNQNEPPN